MRNQVKKCRYCESQIPKDAVGLNKKLFEGDSKRGLLMCLPCMASVLECTSEDLALKIEEFKAAGCKLFS